VLGLRPRCGPPVPGSPWTRSRTVPGQPSGGVAPDERVTVNFLFDENPSTPDRLRRLGQQVAQALNDLIRSGRLTVNYLGRSAEIAITEDLIEDALGEAPVLSSFAVLAGSGLCGGGTLGDQQGSVSICHGAGRLQPGRYTINTLTPYITIDQFGHVVNIEYTAVTEV
jgi:hypothetical protein